MYILLFLTLSKLLDLFLVHLYHINIKRLLIRDGKIPSTSLIYSPAKMAKWP